MTLQIAFIGFGEVGQLFASSWPRDAASTSRFTTSCSTIRGEVPT